MFDKILATDLRAIAVVGANCSMKDLVDEKESLRDFDMIKVS